MGDSAATVVGVRDAGAATGAGEGEELGKGVSVGAAVFVDEGVALGKGVSVGASVLVDEGVALGKGVSLDAAVFAGGVPDGTAVLIDDGVLKPAKPYRSMPASARRPPVKSRSLSQPSRPAASSPFAWLRQVLYLPALA